MAELAEPLAGAEAAESVAEECIFCYSSLEDIEIGTPEGCNHHFCLSCIRVWVRESNTCPIDRHRFFRILVTDEKGKSGRSIPVEQARQTIPSDVNLDIFGWEDWDGELFRNAWEDSSVDRVMDSLDNPPVNWSEVRATLPEYELNRPRPATWNPVPAGAFDYNWWMTSGQSHQRDVIRLNNRRMSRPSSTRVDEVLVDVEHIRQILNLPNRAERHRQFANLLQRFPEREAVERLGNPPRTTSSSLRPLRRTQSSQVQDDVSSGTSSLSSSDIQERRARRKYSGARRQRLQPIRIPDGENPHVYRLSERLIWASELTARLPRPKSPLEARFKIQNPNGEPFPNFLPVWASWWHQAPRRSPRAAYYDLCKLLWLEGFPVETFPRLGNSVNTDQRHVLVH